MAEPNDSDAIRMAGIVLSAVGCLAMVIITGWNALTDYPSLDSLAPVSGTVMLAEVRTISTRTSMEKWIVIDVEPDAKDTQSIERWVFPQHTEFLAERVIALPVGAKVSGQASTEPQRLRWSEDPVRVIWSLSTGNRLLASYDQIVELEKAAHYQSPVAGLIMIGLGVFLILGSRMRLETSTCFRPDVRSRSLSRRKCASEERRCGVRSCRSRRIAARLRGSTQA